MSGLANDSSGELSLVEIDGNSPLASLESAKNICLEAFGHWGSVPRPGSSSSAPLPVAYVAVHRVHGVCGFAVIKKHHQPGHLPQNNGVLHTVCVEKRLRGLGIGTGLVGLVVERARLCHELDYLLLAAQKGPNQPRLLSLYARCGFLKMEGEEMSNMGSRLAGKISEESVSKLASFLSSRNKKTGNSNDVVGDPGNVWMKLRLRNRCVESKRGVKIVDSDFPLPEPPPPFPLTLVRNKRLLIDFEPQVGPSCGLTCLHMIRGALRLVDGADLLTIARKSGVTRDGEMFSTRNLAQLCSDVLPMCEVSFHTTFPSAGYFSISMMSSIFLVPFDIVGNSVGCREGNSSHWGIVSSCLKPLGGGGGGNESSPLFLHIQHSQNRVPILTEYRQLMESNRQLLETNAKFSGGNALSGTSIEIKVRWP